MLSHHRWRRLLAVSMVVLCAGCMSLLEGKEGNSPLTPLAAAPESVRLDIVFLRYASDDVGFDRELWQFVDEQHVPIELRTRLAANGFRAGVLSSQLPPNLEKRLQLTDKPQSTETTIVGDALDRQSPVRQRSLQLRAGRRASIICTGEQQKRDELAVLIREEDGNVAGKTYRKVSGLFAARAMPQGDGRVQLELTPELEHGDPQRRFDPSDGVLRVDFGPAREKFESLRMETVLAPGQMLIVSGIHERPGSLGHHYFAESGNDRKENKLLLVRLSQTAYEDSFSTDAAHSEPMAEKE